MVWIPLRSWCIPLVTICWGILNTQGLHYSHSTSRCAAEGTANLDSIHHVSHCLTNKCTVRSPNQVIFKHLSIRSPRQVSVTRVDLDAGVCILDPSWTCLNWIAHGTTPDILAWLSFFISGYFKGCDWPPFCEWQVEQIWLLLIPRVTDAIEVFFSFRLFTWC
jgi:hypothetical protein